MRRQYPATYFFPIPRRSKAVPVSLSKVSFVVCGAADVSKIHQMYRAQASHRYVRFKMLNMIDAEGW